MSPSDETTLDQLLAEPIVKQLMRRDGIDESAIRNLLLETCYARRGVQTGDDPGADDPHWVVRLRRGTSWPW